MDMTSRIQHWLAFTWGASREAEAVVQSTPPDLEAIRQAMRLAVAPCSNDHRARATGQIARADSALELWLLRSSLYHYLAQDLGQAEATRRCSALLPLFKDAVPGTAPRQRFGDNGAHGQRLH